MTRNGILDLFTFLIVAAVAAPLIGAGLWMFLSAVNADNWLIALAIVCGAYYLGKQALSRG